MRKHKLTIALGIIGFIIGTIIDNIEAKKNLGGK